MICKRGKGFGEEMAGEETQMKEMFRKIFRCKSHSERTAKESAKREIENIVQESR